MRGLTRIVMGTMVIAATTSAAPDAFNPWDIYDKLDTGIYRDRGPAFPIPLSSHVEYSPLDCEDLDAAFEWLQRTRDEDTGPVSIGERPPTGTMDPVPDRMAVYKTIGDVELRLHIFLPDDHGATDRRPAIVFFFGGGWNQGTPSQFYPHCEHLAAHGMVAMSAEYRVKTRHGTSPRECVTDGLSAIRWVRAHAGELGIDPDRIAAGGGSAGGQVAAATGTVNGFDEPAEDRSISARPNALVLFNPVYDNGPEGYGHDRVRAYWREISPMHNLGPDMPPTIVFLGTRDRLIPVSTARAYQQAMEANGRYCELHLYDGQPHGFFNFRNTEYYDRTVQAMDRFLASLGYLAGDDESEPTTGGGR